MSTKKVAPRLKNYMSEMEVDESITIIRRSLAEHGAKRIIFDGNDGQGNPTEMSFVIVVNGQSLAFRMPVHFERVQELVEKAWKEYGRALRDDALRAQAQRTAWANVKDWTLAQMALIESSAVKMEEVFFPYMLGPDEQTMFEAFEQRLALPAPRNNRATCTVQAE
jgi:hypothetical protein